MTADANGAKWAAADSNCRLPPCEDGNTTSEPQTGKGLTEADPPACTNACTDEPENDNGNPPIMPEVEGDGNPGTDPLATLAAAVAGLSAADRARLAAMLGGSSE
ncbi:MAG: hypothetical protein RBS80_01930 [Thermoguttaceae bacterium]|nr:hypothetical protein [Thermoguttaceae bacterium]